MQRTVLALTVAVLLGAGCGRTPLNSQWREVPLGDAGAPADGLVPRDDAGRPIDAPVATDGPRVLDGPGWFDAGRPDAPRPDASWPFDAARPDAPGLFDAARPDVPPAPDGAAQSDGGSTPGVVTCGATTCDAATQECCVTLTGASCIASGAQCLGVTAECDGPEDCASPAQICCARTWGPNRGLSCTQAGACNNGERICHLDADCASGSRCCGEASFAGLSFQFCAPAASCPNVDPTPGVPCGSTSCFTPQVCCRSFTGSSCTAPNACNQGLPYACDGPEDCGGTTPVCCAQLTSGSSCVATGSCSAGVSGGVVCHVSADCAGGQTCTEIPMLNLRLCR